MIIFWLAFHFTYAVVIHVHMKRNVDFRKSTMIITVTS